MDSSTDAPTKQALPEALRLADLGYPILPCVPGEKRPLTTHGLKDASTDAEQIERWWTEYPAANVAIRTDGLLVIDIDAADGDWPNASRCEDLTVAPMATTPRGGSHFIFRQPPGKHWRNTSKRLAPDVDTRADDGYILVSPSVTSNGSYRWIQRLDVSAEHLPEPPAWLIDEVDRLHAPPPPPDGPKLPPCPATVHDGRERLALAAMLRMKVADEKDGSKRVLKAACRAVEFDLGDDQAATAMGHYFAIVPAPRDYSRDELLKRVRDAERDCTRGSALHNGQATAEKSEASPIIVRAAEVQTEPVRWLWPNRIALGKLTLIAGDPGLGKSFLTLDMTARVTTGDGWPDGANPNPPGGVVIASAEDDPSDTIVPRLQAAGADLERVHFLQGVRNTFADGSSDRCLSLADIPIIESTIDGCPDCRSLFVDPVSAYLGKADSHVNAEVRAVLAPLADLAARKGIAVVAVTHLRKGEGQAVYRAMGSLAFVAAARAVWAVTKDKDDPKRRLLLPIKNNLAEDSDGLAFSLARWPEAPAARIAWELGRVNVSVDEALATPKGKPGPEAEALEDASDWLRTALADGPRLARELREEATEGAGISYPTLRRAQASIGAVPYREVIPGPWWWKLPQSQDAQPEHLGPPSKELEHLEHLEHLAFSGPLGGVSEGGQPQHAQDAQDNQV